MNKEQASHNTPPAEEDRGEREKALEAAKLLVSVAEVYAEYTAILHSDPSDKNRRKRDVAWQAYQDQSVVCGEQIARALLSAPRVEGDARLFIENVAACSEDDRVGVLRVLAERILATGSLSPQGE